MNTSKKLLGFAFCLFSLQAFSQECSSFLFFQKNKTIEFTSTNKKGDPLGRTVYQVTDVSKGDNGTTAVLNSEVFNKNGKSVAKSNATIQCNGGLIMVDMRMMLPQQQQEQVNANVKAQSFYLEYPSTMHVGDALKDGSLSMDLSMAGGPGAPPPPPGPGHTMNMWITNRKVEGQENVTTPAGTWNCFKITYHAKVQVKTGPIGFPFNFDGTEWYAPGFGIVKSETNKGGTTSITSIK